tara:strand:+ start:4641 stop:6137 length:1497 start_codon:yes stop_codon:yes gene_type:complete
MPSLHDPRKPAVPTPLIPLDDQYKTPLFDAMVALAESRKVSFHTPGHKSGKGISTRFRKFVGPKIFSIDLTTLDEVDSLQKPKGVIKEAQHLAALAYGADQSYFLVNGTSGGVHAMLATTCQPGETILIARNAHKSVVTGLILSGASPVYFPPIFDPNLQLTMNVSCDEVKDAIAKTPEARTLFLTSPNYYGLCAELEPIIDHAHKKNITVLLDEAHGPHLKFHEKLPISGLDAGADLVVQSTHKIIGGMTQASMLHAKADHIDLDRLAQTLRLLQTTSPSYILMASLDLARMQMATEGEKLLGTAIYLAEDARERINQIPGLQCFGHKDHPYLDVTKLTIQVRDLGLTGFQVSQKLNTQYRVQAEMADPFHVLVIISIGDRKNDLDRLVDALQHIAADSMQSTSDHLVANPGIPPVPGQRVLTPREAFLADHHPLPLCEATGKISAEVITIYPPGIALLVPGEVITSETIKYICRLTDFGATIDGLDQESTMIQTVK